MSARPASRVGTRRRARSRGYTAVEVLMAMTLFAIGAAGVIGMQRVTMQGGEDARRVDMATNIANEWLSRLQRDASFWTEPSSDKPTTINLVQNTQWLKQVGSCNQFCKIPMPTTPSPEGLSPAFDMFGRDLPDGTKDAWYCAQYRLTWIQDPGTAPSLKLTGLMRAEVRVYWSRLEANPIGDCSQPPDEIIPTGTASPFHMVYGATAIRSNARR
jgi:prepilin-type N-terminal cleavage/methylation domain-containing protein